MAKSLIITCAFCCLFNRTISAPIIKASGVQWSEPKGTGKGNITLIMIPQNNSCGNDSDMIVAVKSDYQIMSQDTQLLNLVVNEKTNKNENVSKCDTSLKKFSSLKEDNLKKQERDPILKPQYTAKYFEPENKLTNENTTNNTVNIYPVLVKNYQNLVDLNGTSTTLSYGTVNVFQLLNMGISNNKYESSNTLKVSSDTYFNNATSKYDGFNLTKSNNASLETDNAVRSKSDNISLTMVGSDDNFLNEALNILEKLKQDPSYYNKLKSNQIPSTEEIKENGEISLTDSQSKFVKLDDSALAFDEGECLGREFGHMNNENQDISNLEGNVKENILTSTCLPFFMSLNSDQTTTQLTDLNIPKEISFEKVPLKGTGSNMSQELSIRDNATIPEENVSFTSKCQPLFLNNTFGETSATKLTPVESYITTIIGYGVQSNDSSQTLSNKNCTSSNGLYNDYTNVTPLISATSQTVYSVNGADSITNDSKGEPSYLLVQQTLAAANIAAGSELSVTASVMNFTDTRISVSGYDSYLSLNQTEQKTATSSGENLVLSKLEQTLAAANIAAGSEPSVTASLINFTDTSISVSGYDSYSSLNQTERVTSSSSRENLALSNIEQNNTAPSAGEIKAYTTSENQVLNISQPEIPVTKTDRIDQRLLSMPTLPMNGITSKALPNPNELEIKSTECVSNALLQTVSPTVINPTSTNSFAAGLKVLSEMQTECVSDPSVDIKHESGLPQAGVGAIPKKITLEPQISCGTTKKEESSSLCPIDGREVGLNDKDLTPLVKSSIFLANNNEMSKGNDIPISLNASLDEFILSDLQEKEDLRQGKVAELYKRNPLQFNVEREPSGTLLKSHLRYYKNDISKSPNLYLNKLYKPESNPILKLNLDGNNVIFEKRPAYKAETNNKVCNNTLNSNKLTNDEIEPADNDNIILNPEPNSVTPSQIIVSSKPNLYGGVDEKYMGNTIKTLDSQQHAGEEDKLLTILNTLDKTTVGMSPNDNYQEDVTFLNISTITPSKQDENMNSKLNNLINLTTLRPNFLQTLCLKPSGRISSKPHKSNVVKTQVKEKMCIPADSLQQIVIEIVKNTKKPENDPDSFTKNPKYDNKERFQNIGGKRKEMSHNEMGNIKQNFVPFQSAWKPVQSIEKKTGIPISDSIQPNLDNNEQIKGSLKPEISESDSVQERYIQNKNTNNKLYENQNTNKQDQIPAYIKEYNPYHQTAKNQEKSLGANILKLLMADKSVFKNK